MKIPQKIKDNCPSCHPVRYTKTTCSYANEKEKLTTDDGFIYEYLYKCDNCNAGLWIYEDDLKRLEIKENKNDDIKEEINIFLNGEQLSVLENFRIDKITKFKKDLELNTVEMNYFAPISIERYQNMNYGELLKAYLDYQSMVNENV